MIVVGIDPGTRKTGYAVLRAIPRHVELLDLGVWGRAADDRPLGDRLEDIHQRASALFKEWNPRWIGLEKAVAFKNIPSALTLSEARGVLRLAAHQSLDRSDQRLVELSPTRIKKSAVGSGSAAKAGVEKALRLRFPELKNLTERDIPHDAFDALAIAWTVWVDMKRAMFTRSREGSSCPL